jgi:hypothetical protein
MFFEHSMCWALAQATELHGKMRVMLIPLVPPGLWQLPVRGPLPARRHWSANLRWFPSLRLALCLLAVSWQAACGGPVEFDLVQTIAQERVMGNPAGGALMSFLPTPVDLTANVQQAAVAHKANTPVISVALTALQFQAQMTGASPSTFDFLQTLSVSVGSTRANTTLAQQLVATLAGPPGKSVSINLNPIPTANLLPFLSEGAHLTASATGTQPSQDVTYTGSLTIHVKTL